MREFQIPSFSVVAFAAAAWLFGLAVLLVTQISAGVPIDVVVSRGLLSGFALVGALYMTRLGLGFRRSGDNSKAMVKEVRSRIDETRRAA